LKKLIIILLLLWSSYSFAQKPLSKKERRKQHTNFLLPVKPWTAELPFWIPGFAGSFAYGDVDIEGEDGVNPVNPIEPPPGGEFGKIISRLFQDEWYLKFFFITRISYEQNKFLAQFDAISGSVGSSVKFKLNNSEIVQANFRSINLRVFGGYKIVEAMSNDQKFRYELFGYVGTRIYLQAIYSDLNKLINRLDINPVWADPLIGIQNQFTLKRWQFLLQADYGGFFGKTDYSNQFTFNTYFRLGKTTSIKAGWNHLHIFKTGTILREDYLVKVTLSGPSIGVAFHF